jgi:cytochrome c oxidase subunit 2
MAHFTKRRSVVAVIGLCGAIAAASALWLGRTGHAAEPVIGLTVKRFEYSPREIRLKKGVPVVLEITSLDVPHGFNLPDLHVRADVLPGRVTRVRVIPDRAGTFTFRCDVFCGTRHEELDGSVIVSD